MSTEGQLVTRPSAIGDLRAELQKWEPEFKKALAGAIDAGQFLRTALTTMRGNPRLLDCSRESVIGSMLQAAQLGLEVDGVLGQGYLVPYRRECQFQPGYRGLVVLAMRSGLVASIEARDVRAGDDFDWCLGLDATLRHKPSDDDGRDDESGDNLTHVYAIARMVTGARVFEVLTRRQVDQHRAKSAAYGSGKEDTPWRTHYPPMARKTAIRMLVKTLPASSRQLALAVALDEQGEMGAQNYEKPATPTTLDDLKAQAKAVDAEVVRGPGAEG